MLYMLVLILAGIAAGCVGEPTLPRPTGTYTLQSLSNQSLPAVLAGTEPRMIAVVSGSISLHSDGTFHSRIVHRPLSDAHPQDIVQETTGRYGRRGETVTLHHSNGDTDTFAIENGGTTLRTVAATRTGPGLDILEIYIYRALSG